MTDEQDDQEGVAEGIEDLEAPATAQAEVVGGSPCGKPTCTATMVCIRPTCNITKATCEDASGKIIVFEA